MPDTRIEDVIRQAAKASGIPAELALAVAEQESGFNPTAQGREITVGGKKTRAIGTFQLLPSTAANLGVDPSDPMQNIVGGTRYLRQLLDRHEGNIESVLKEYGGVVDDTTYVPSVMGRMSKFQGAPAAAPAAVAPPGTGFQAPVGTGGRGTGAGPTGARPGGATARTPVGPSNAPVATDMASPAGMVEAALTPFDPRNPEGRQNLAATAGAVALSAATKGLPVNGLVPWIVRAVAGPAGAAMMSAAETGVEQGVGAQPVDPMAQATEAGKQAAFEVAGQALFMWPVRRIMKSMIEGTVARNATIALDKGIVEASEKKAVETAAARERVRQGVQAVTDMTKASVTAAKAAGTVATRETRKQGAERLAQVELENNAVMQGLRGQYDSVLAQPPSILGMKGTVRDVIEGPAKVALEKAGERVQQAAAGGPPISTQPLQDALTQMNERLRPQSIFGVTDGAAADPTTALLNRMSPAQRSAAAAQVGMADASVKDLARALGVPDTHPLPGILGKLQNAPSQLTFSDAHALKMSLDEAVNWDRTAAKALEKMTKGVRSVLREQLGAYEPYNTATAAYQAVIPLYRKGVGKAVIAAAKSPDGAAQIARSLRAESPDGALALRDLLLTQSAAGGDAALGQQAWDQVRAAFVYDKVLTGGVEGLQGRLKSLLTEHPEFSKVMFSDRTALTVLSNLEQLGQAFQSAMGSAAEKTTAAKTAARAATTATQEAGAAKVARIKDAGRGALEAAKQAGHSEIESVKAAGRASVTEARLARKTLEESSLLNRSVISQGADALRATFQGPTSVWGALSIMRLLNGPSSADLLQFVGHSSRLTQNVVQILNAQAPDRIVSDTMRDIVGVLMPAPVPSHSASGGGAHTQEPAVGPNASATADAR